MIKSKWKAILFFIMLALITSCGSDDDPAPAAATAAATTSSVYPNGLAVSSLTASQSTSLISEGDALYSADYQLHAEDVETYHEDDYSDKDLDEKNIDQYHLNLAATLNSTQSYAEKKAILDAIAIATSATSCQITLSDVTTNVTDPTCYGPALDYVFHLDYTGTGNENGQLPTGDLGLWSATESDGSSCSAAKLNKENQKIASQMDLALLLVASTSCLINTNTALTVPAIGSTLTFTTEFNAALSVNNATTTVTTATLERLANYDSNPLYQYTYVLTQGATTVTLNVKHNPTNSTNSTYKGKVWGKFVGGMPGVAASRATSLLYERTATNINYKMLSVSYNGGAIANPFNASYDVDPTINWSGNFSQTIINQNASTGLGYASYAWQAGRNDDSSRVFNMYTSTSGTNTVGYGFFGYGTNFNPTTGALSTNLITKFICNWAGPSNNHTGLSGNAQKQFFILSGGIFIPDTSVADAHLISYAPINSCDMTLGQTRGGAGGAFKYKLITGAYETTQPAVTNELVTLSTDIHYTVFTNNAPTAPTDF